MASGHGSGMAAEVNTRIGPTHRVLVVLATLVVVLALAVGINIDHEWGASYQDGSGTTAQ
jgi:hypothetical protein